MHMRHWSLRVALVFALPCAPALAAQIVRGAVVDSASGQPLYGALVELLDGSSKQQVGAFSDEQGHFAIKAVAPGRYTLRTERIGYKSTMSAPFDLTVGQSVQRQLAAPLVPLVLPAVQVAVDHRCTVHPREGAQSWMLWEDARKALNATALAQARHLLRIRVKQFERDLDVRTLGVKRERSWEHSLVGETPWVSIPAESLAAAGFVQTTAGGATWYYAPDATVLLSDVFLNGHCLRVQEADDQQKGLIGLAFEPARKPHLPDVRGVLWLDEKSRELRYIEYRYSGLSLPELTTKIGGRLEFQRLPSGAWLVHRWAIRMPKITIRRNTFHSPTSPTDASSETISGISEVGGEVVGMEQVPLGQVSEGQVSGVGCQVPGTAENLDHCGGGWRRRGGDIIRPLLPLTPDTRPYLVSIPGAISTRNFCVCLIGPAVRVTV